MDHGRGVTVAADGVRAAARLVAEPDGRGGTVLPLLSGDGPIALRRTRARAPWAGVTIVGAMSAPLGGDRLALEVEVRAGARVRVGSAAATVALPGHGGGRATYGVDLTVGRDAELRWLPQPLISAAGSDLATATRVRLAEGARLVLGETQVLGRSGEPPGHLVSRLTVELAGRPLLDQELALGPGEPGWSGPAVLAGHRAVGQLLVVDAAFAGQSRAARVLTQDPDQGVAVLTPLEGPAVLVTSVARDALTARRLLDSAGLSGVD